MKFIAPIVLLLLFTICSQGQINGGQYPDRVSSMIDSTNSPELVLIQEFSVIAPIEMVWKAYSTK